MPHLEVIVNGPPISSQSKSKVKLLTWKAVIRSEVAKHWGSRAPLTSKVRCTILYFHEGDTASMDDDNMVKPIRAAMNRLVYEDDSQICYSETIQISIDASMKLRRASLALLAAFSVGNEFVYIRIDDMPETIQLPE